MGNKKNAKTKKTNNKKKSDNIVIIVLGCVIVFLIIVMVVLYKTAYFKDNDFVIDYLQFSANNYKKSDLNLITSEDDLCHIRYSSKIVEKNDLLTLGEKETINNHDWVKQEFENGITWISYYKNSYYIVQMYANDQNTYTKECQKDFEKIKQTFIFLKNE